MGAQQLNSVANVCGKDRRVPLHHIHPNMTVDLGQTIVIVAESRMLLWLNAASTRF